MPLSEADLELIEEFRNYVEGFVDGDDRYGPASRVDSDDQSIMACRFEAGGDGWLEVAVHTAIPQVRVGYLTRDESLGSETEQAILDEGGTLPGHVGQAFSEAGLDWPDPPVEQSHVVGEYSYFATPLEIDELGDLEFGDTRSQAVRMLEGYLIAFGSEIDFDPDDEDEVDEPAGL